MIIRKFSTDENNEIVEVFEDTDSGEISSDSDLLKKRYQIQELKGDIYSMVAQSIQWNSLLTSLLKDLYTALDDETKNRIPPDVKGLIDATFAYYDTIETTADVKLKEEGFDFIKDILDKEAETAKLFK